MTDNMKGKPPFGYTVTGPPTERRLVPDAAQQVVVQRMHALSAEGRTATQIAATLNAEGIPSPRDGGWSPVAARQVLNRPPVGYTHVEAGAVVINPDGAQRVRDAFDIS